MDRHLKEHLAPYRWHILAVFVLHTISILCIIGIILHTRNLLSIENHTLDSFLGSGRVHTMIFLAVIDAIAIYLRQYLSYKVSYGVVEKVRSNLYRRLLDADTPSEISDRPEVLSVLFISQMNQIQRFIQITLNTYLGFPIILTAIVFFTSIFDVWLTLTMVALLSVVCILSYRLYRKVLGYVDDQIKGMSAVNECYNNNIRGARTIRFIGDLDSVTDDFISKNKVYGRANRTMELGTYYYPCLVTAVVNLTIAGCYAYMGIMFVDVMDFLEEFVVALQFLPLYLDCFLIVPSIAIVYPAMKLSWDRISEILDKDPVENPSGIVPDVFDGPEVELDNVSFDSYGGRMKIKDISLKVERGEKLMIVGQSFNGKGIIGKIIANVYEPSSGTVRYRGMDSKTLDRELLKDRLTYVGSNSSFLPTDLRGNIDPSGRLSDSEIEGLMELTGIDPGKTNTSRNPGASFGLGLSESEGQRIAFCRAVAKDSEIYVFDSAFHSMELGRRIALMGNVLSRLEGKTVITISSDTMFGPLVDRILFLEDGSIVSEGSHEELLSSNETYRRMYELENHMGGIQ